MPVWKFEVAANEQMITSSRHRTHDAVYSASKILGDRTSLTKYISKHLISIATVKHSKSEASSVHVYLVDGLTGSLLHHTYHSNAKDPVTIAQAENWLVYQYYNLKHHRFEVAVLELYEKHSNWQR